MSQWHRNTALLAVVALAGALAGGWYLLHPRPAQACGGFFRARTLVTERRPSLAFEQTLIVFDAAKRREHFVREVVFRDSSEPFGFVVPVPTRPTVNAVDKSPFASLAAAFPFERPPSSGDERKAAVPSRGGGGMAMRGVRVLEVRQIGSFKSFVLAANDARALKGWLDQNGFVTTPATKAWLAHYVTLKFFYVAMRYEPRGAQRGEATAETVRISFDAPLPYYPYLEPEAEAGNSSPRMLDVWLASQRHYAPVALNQQGGRSSWVRPMKAGLEVDDSAEARLSLTLALNNDISYLPEGQQLVVQRFADQKSSRRGFGDVVFVPVGEPVLSDAERAKLAVFAALLDPSLGEAP